MATLNEVMKDTADAIREKKGTSDLIAPVNFATEIKGITAGGGGADLEGEYFLAKPNGRCKKITFINGYVDPSNLSEEQLMAMLVITLAQGVGCCYSGFVCTASAGSGLNKNNFVENPIYLANKIGSGAFIWRGLTSDDNTTINYGGVNENTCFAWEEMDVYIEGLTLSFIYVAQLALIEILGNEPSVEEVYALLQIEDVDKAVYDEWKNREY